MFGFKRSVVRDCWLSTTCVEFQIERHGASRRSRRKTPAQKTLLSTRMAENQIVASQPSATSFSGLRAAGSAVIFLAPRPVRPRVRWTMQAPVGKVRVGRAVGFGRDRGIERHGLSSTYQTEAGPQGGPLPQVQQARGNASPLQDLSQEAALNRCDCWQLRPVS